MITIQPESQTLKDTESSILALWIVATGVGPIHYKWQKYDPSSDSWIPPSSRAEDIESHNLSFVIITEEDEGVYHCNVSNDDGFVLSDPVNISVYGEYR